MRGRWTLFPRVLHGDWTDQAIAPPDHRNVVRLARGPFLYVTDRTRGSRGERLTAQQKRQGSLWSQRNLYRDVIEPARIAADVDFKLYDARHTFVSTLIAAGVPLPEVAAYSGQSVGDLAGLVAGQPRLRSQTTLAVYTHPTGRARKKALKTIDAYLEELLKSALRLRAALTPRHPPSRRAHS
jgi:integrase